MGESTDSLLRESKSNFIDFHCHPAMKPFGKSFNRASAGKNSSRRNKKNSIWKYDPPTLADKLFNFIGGFTKFSQSNFTSLSKAEVSVICASLYPIEREFFDNSLDPEKLKDVVLRFVTGVGRKRVNHIQKITNYFQDLELEYDFYLQLSQQIITLPHGKVSYQLVRNYSEIEAIQSHGDSSIETICVIPSIEGLHVLNENIQAPVNATQILANLNKIKNWEYPPFFISVAHHFWNHICGHAQSFSGVVTKFINQQKGLNEGITDLGKQVIHEMLNAQNGRRILIDVKHMSVQSRKEYYEIRSSHPDAANIPVIVSHGAMNGFHSFDDTTVKGSQVSNKLQHTDINVFNSEIILVAQSKGIIGLQLDERRLANEDTLKQTKKSLRRHKLLHYRSELLWNQIQHIVEILDQEGLFAWDCIAIGSDFDGIIDPLNGFWTAEELPYLQTYIERHAYNYLQSNSFQLSSNAIKADEVVERIFSLNGHELLKRFYH